MKLKLEDGRQIDSEAVGVYEELVHAVAMLGLLDNESLVWLRSRVSDLVPHSGPSDEAEVFDAFKKAIAWHIEDNRQTGGG